MSGMVLEGMQFFFGDARRGRVLLADAGDFAANRSRALLHYIDDDCVWVMRDNLKNITEYILRDTASGTSLRAAMAVLAVRALWGKHRPRRILWTGTVGRAAIAVAKMMPIFHDENLLYAVSPDLPEPLEKNIVPIRAAHASLPLPEDYFDVAVVDAGGIAPDRLAQILLSLRAGGLLLLLLPTGTGLSAAMPGAEFLADDDGNTLVQVRGTRALAAMFREGTARGRIERQKRLIAYILDEIGDTLGAVLTDGNGGRLDAVIAQAALAEETILPVYEELAGDDLKYLANRFKEALIEFRLHGGEERKAQVLESYLALRRDMKACDDF